MNFTNIEYFLAIAEEGSISAAARKLYVSQQSLSEHLKKLETELGVPLIKRGKELELTIAGECFVADGKEILKARNRLKNDISYVTEQRHHLITLGIPTHEAPPYLPDLLHYFRQKHPDFEIVVKKRQHSDISHNMQGIDLYLSPCPLDMQLEQAYILDEDPYVAVVHKQLMEKIYGDKFQEKESEILSTKQLSALKEVPFLLTLDRLGHPLMDYQLILESYDFNPICGFKSENLELNAALCAKGFGIYLGPRFYCKERFFSTMNVPKDEILMYSITTTGLNPALAISYPKGQSLNTGEKLFIETMREFVKNRV